jgi:hypothetical protein
MSEEIVKAPSRKKTKFSMNQVVIFRFGSRNLVGKVIDVRPISKKIGYLLLAEDGKEYGHMFVDTVHDECIDTRLTKIFYKQYNLDLNAIPEHIIDTVESNVRIRTVEEEPEPVEDDHEDEILFDFDEAIPFDED